MYGYQTLEMYSEFIDERNTKYTPDSQRLSVKKVKIFNLYIVQMKKYYFRHTEFKLFN